MSAGLKGKLTVTIHKARDLKDVQTFGKQDPYCIIQLGGEHFKTRVHNDGGKNPSWEQAYLFNLTGVEDAVHIKINDSETLLDRPIGRVDIGLVELITSTKNGPAWFLVHDVNNFSINAGNISISTTFEGTGLVQSSTNQPQQVQQQTPQQTPQQQPPPQVQQQPSQAHIQHQPSGNLYPGQQYQQQQQQQHQHQPVYQQQPSYAPQPVYQQQPQQPYQPQYQQPQAYPQQVQYPQGYASPPPQYQPQPVYPQQPVYQQQPIYQQPPIQMYPGQAPSGVVYGTAPAAQQVYVPQYPPQPR